MRTRNMHKAEVCSGPFRCPLKSVPVHFGTYIVDKSPPRTKLVSATVTNMQKQVSFFWIAVFSITTESRETSINCVHDMWRETDSIGRNFSCKWAQVFDSYFRLYKPCINKKKKKKKKKKRKKIWCYIFYPWHLWLSSKTIKCCNWLYSLCMQSIR